MSEGTEPTPEAQPPSESGAAPPPAPGSNAPGEDGEKKEGLSVLAWVGIGCGTLVVLTFASCAVAGYMGMAWLGGMVAEFEENPAMASARMIVRTNPELELVDSDDEAGTLTVRNRQTGETVTVDLQQIEQGRIRFESGDEEVTLGVEEDDEGGGALTVRDKEGTTQFRAGSGGDEDIPDWVPRYPDVAPTGTTFMQSGGEISGGFTVETEDSLEDVIEYYREALEAAGFAEASYSTSRAGGTRNANLMTESGNRMVSVIVNEEGGTTRAVVTFAEGT